MSSVARAGRGGRAWPLGPRATALLIAGCLAAGAAGGVALHGLTAPPARPAAEAAAPALPAQALAADITWPPGRRPAPSFALHDQAGRLVSLASRRGHPVLLTFMDSQCKLICTLEGPAIGRALRHATVPRGVSLLVVSVNPWEDTAASTRLAGERYGFGGDWHWLRGTPDELRRVWSAYAIGVRRTSGDVNHSTAIYLIDGHGFERAGFNFPFGQRRMERALSALAG
jgi:cytochrome oxidase Cu insertion factor (SCO1/SenC/PrrC family)